MTPPCPCPYCARKRSRRPATTEDMRRTAMWWLGRGVRRLAGIEPFPTDERN